MKRLTVKWFAAYRDATGVTEESVETAAATTADLFAEMTERHPALGGYRRALVAINNEMKDWAAGIGDGDEVLFFPPVAGG
ncbi:MoaD/ThiS family protein [Elongatibacter sediminis]|uniref:Molybdopterin synthase sulfur carrier subunit n=1 Tax=Elongatibacter sediminis TaxID=3119006 RepID=A0AAW9RL41_9GAMM